MSFLSNDMAPEHIEQHELIHQMEAYLGLNNTVCSVYAPTDEHHSITVTLKTGTVFRFDMVYIDSQEIK